VSVSATIDEYFAFAPPENISTQAVQNMRRSTSLVIMVPIVRKQKLLYERKIMPR
jgi:hypothetical protein